MRAVHLLAAGLLALPGCDDSNMKQSRQQESECYRLSLHFLADYVAEEEDMIELARMAQATCEDYCAELGQREIVR